MRALANRAGVSSATPYNLFGSKHAILVALLNDDLAEYQAALGDVDAGGIEVMFEAVRLTRRFLDRDPEIYRCVVAEISQDGGNQLRQLFGGPRYMLWKNMIAHAAQEGLLNDALDLDAFTITVTQTIAANVQEWALGQLTLDEMELRVLYALALMLLAIATDTSRGTLKAQLCRAEGDLQQMWRTQLKQHLERGELDADMQMLLADQLQHIERL